MAFCFLWGGKEGCWNSKRVTHLPLVDSLHLPPCWEDFGLGAWDWGREREETMFGICKRKKKKLSHSHMSNSGWAPPLPKWAALVLFMCPFYVKYYNTYKVLSCTFESMWLLFINWKFPVAGIWKNIYLQPSVKLHVCENLPHCIQHILITHPDPLSASSRCWYALQMTWFWIFEAIFNYY